MPTRVGAPTIKADCALWDASSDQSDGLAETTRCISVIVPRGYNLLQLKNRTMHRGDNRQSTRGVYQHSSKIVFSHDRPHHHHHHCHLYYNPITISLSISKISFYLQWIFVSLISWYFMYIVAVLPSHRIIKQSYCHSHLKCQVHFLFLPFLSFCSQAPPPPPVVLQFNHRHQRVSDVVIFCYLWSFNYSADEL